MGPSHETTVRLCGRKAWTGAEGTGTEGADHDPHRRRSAAMVSEASSRCWRRQLPDAHQRRAERVRRIEKGATRGDPSSRPARRAAARPEANSKPIEARESPASRPLVRLAEHPRRLNASIRIVALSDQHGHLPGIPECDVLVVAGDVCPDRFGPFLAIHYPEQQRVPRGRPSPFAVDWSAPELTEMSLMMLTGGAL